MQYQAPQKMKSRTQITQKPQIFADFVLVSDIVKRN